jgi:hypothetical protein
MLTINIQLRKIEFVRDFLKIEDEELLVLLEQLLHSAKSDAENNIQSMSVEELNQ